MSYTVKSGDNLSKIASQYGLSWQDVYNANKSTVGSNPNLIYPGQTFNIPGQSAPSYSAPSGGGATYTVQPGDSLSRIAQGLGISKWQDIYALNKASIRNPNLIYPGQQINLPMLMMSGGQQQLQPQAQPVGAPQNIYQQIRSKVGDLLTPRSAYAQSSQPQPQPVPTPTNKYWANVQMPGGQFPKPAPTTTPEQRLTGRLNREQAMNLIQKHFPKNEWENAYKTMMAESSGNVGAIGVNKDKARSKDYGLFQINDYWQRQGLESQGLNIQDMKDPEKNVKYAAWLQKRQGWKPWYGAQKVGLW